MDNVLRLNKTFASDKLDALSNDLFLSKQLPCKFVDILTMRGYEIGGETYSDKNGFANQVSSNSSIKKSLSREDALNRLSRKFESSENMQQSDDYKHDGFS